MAEAGDLIAPALASRAFARADAGRWDLTVTHFAAVLDRSARHAFKGRVPPAGELERYVDGLHLEDLALAAACEAGNDGAWEHFILEHRPALYRAAAAIDRGGNGRDLADSLYAELFGLRERQGARQSLFRYFHGRSGLGTWVRAVLAQRHVDRIRAARRLEPLPDDDGPGTPATTSNEHRAASPHHAAMRAALAAALAALSAKDRLRVACYYVQNMKLAAIGRMLGEHEASVSRHLARARGAIRQSIEHHLRTAAGYDADGVTACFRAVADDSGAIDLATMVDLGVEPHGKISGLDRSTERGTSG